LKESKITGLAVYLKKALKMDKPIFNAFFAYFIFF